MSFDERRESEGFVPDPEDIVGEIGAPKADVTDEIREMEETKRAEVLDGLHEESGAAPVQPVYSQGYSAQPRYTGGYQIPPEQQGLHRATPAGQTASGGGGSVPPAGTYGYSAVPDEEPSNGKKDSFGRKLARAVALALVFGLVAGLVFHGVTRFGNRSASTQQPEVEIPQTEVAGEVLPETVEDASEATVSETEVPAVTLVTDVSQIAAATLPSIVQVTNVSLVQYRSFFGQTRVYEQPSAGSGIIVDQDGEYIYIATNNHVVSNSDELTITFCDDASVSAVIVDTLAAKDLAVVAVRTADVPQETLSAIRMATLGESDDLIVGQGAIVIGNALGYGQSVTVGYISALNREVVLQDDLGRTISNSLIQTDAAVNPGNSGGALLNMKGEVIGIVSAKYSDTSVEGMGYAIPITEAKALIAEIIEEGVSQQPVDISGGSASSGRDSQSGSDGNAAQNGGAWGRQDQSQDTSGQNQQEDESASASLPAGSAYLGIYGMDISSDTADSYQMPEGVYVSSVVSEGPAEEAGLQRGDVIVAVGGQEVGSMEEVRAFVTAQKPGDQVEVSYYSWESSYRTVETVTVTLGEVK